MNTSVDQLRVVPKTRLTLQQEKFALRYAVDFDSRAAIDEAGYNCTTDASRDSMASQLLSNLKVKAFLWAIKAEWAAEYKLDADQWFRHLQLIAMEAYNEGDWAGAVSALREIGKHLGCYEVHERQKNWKPEDADRLQAELEARGFSFRRANAPAHLQREVVQPKIVEGTNGSTSGASGGG